MKKALIVQGGWDGHKPVEISDILAEQLRKHDFEVTLADTLDAFCTTDLAALDLVVPNWTMGEITREQISPLLKAVGAGAVGVAGLHGGLGDSFRSNTDYQYMAGGQFICHPGGDGTFYMVHIDGAPHPITEGIEDFQVRSEQYYMHVDPANTVLATTRFGEVVMPVVWIKRFGKGRVFYSSLGHSPEVAAQAEPLTLMTRGMLWAAEKGPTGLSATPIDLEHY
ncbi:MAG: ThuA domain-containing protein [Anaerolineae bacterium]|nr:ThuA domain-containing protein [Anaerolineae bacterium]